MSRGVNQDCAVLPPRRNAGRRADRQRQSGFTLIELLVVMVIVGVLAAVIAPRYADFVGQSRQQAATGALAEGYSRLKQATALYAINKNGAQPQALADLSPDYMNATGSLGDYTAVFTQGSSQVTIDIYLGTDTTGTPLATRAIDWP